MDHILIENFNQVLKEKELTIAFAESITAGMLCSSIASVSGASSILKGGLVTYDEKLKTKLLRVQESTLEKFTAESLQTTIEMALGLQQLDVGANINVAITGVASEPTNNYSITASVGDVFVAVSFNNNMFTEKFNLRGERNEIREQAVEATLKFILKVIA